MKRVKRPCVRCKTVTRAQSGLCPACQMKDRGAPLRPGRRRRGCTECGAVTQAGNGVCRSCQARLPAWSRGPIALRGGGWVLRGAIYRWTESEAS